MRREARITPSWRASVATPLSLATATREPATVGAARAHDVLAARFTQAIRKAVAQSASATMRSYAPDALAGAVPA